MMLGGVAEIMIILVPPLAFFPDMAAIGARQIVRMGNIPLPNLCRDTLTRLYLVSVAR